MSKKLELFYRQVFVIMGGVDNSYNTKKDEIEKMSEIRTIEDRLKESLNGDLLENTLDFVAYLRNIGMTIHPGDPNRFSYMGEYTCILVFFDNMLFICDCPIIEHDSYPLDKSLKEFAQTNIKKCENHDGCDHKERGATKTIFGKEFDNLCSSEIEFFNPDAEGFKKIKMLMEYWKNIIDKQRT